MAVYQRRQQGREQRSMFGDMLNYMMQRALLDAGMRERTAETREENERIRNLNLADSIAGQVQQYITSNFIPPAEADRLMAEAREQFAGMDPSVAQRFDMVSGALPSPSVDDIASNAMASMPPFPGESRDDWLARLEASGVPSFAGLTAPLTPETTSISPLHTATRALGDQYIGAAGKSARGVLEREAALTPPEFGNAMMADPDGKQIIVGGTWSQTPRFNERTNAFEGWDESFTPSPYHNIPQDVVDAGGFRRMNDPMVQAVMREQASAGGLGGLNLGGGDPSQFFTGGGGDTPPTLFGRWPDSPEVAPALDFPDAVDRDFVGSNWETPEGVIQMAQELVNRFDALPQMVWDNMPEEEKVRVGAQIATLEQLAAGQPIEGGITFGEGDASFDEQLGAEGAGPQTFMLDDEKLFAGQMANLFNHPALQVVQGSQAITEQPPRFDEEGGITPGATQGRVPSDDLVSFSNQLDGFPEGSPPLTIPYLKDLPPAGQVTPPFAPLPSQVFDVQAPDVNLQTREVGQDLPPVPPLAERQERAVTSQRQQGQAQSLLEALQSGGLGTQIIPPPPASVPPPAEEWLESAFGKERAGAAEAREKAGIGAEDTFPSRHFQWGAKSGPVASASPDLNRRGVVRGPSIASITGGVEAKPSPTPSPNLERRTLTSTIPALGPQMQTPEVPRLSGADLVKRPPLASTIPALGPQMQPPQSVGRTGDDLVKLPSRATLQSPLKPVTPRPLTPNLGPQTGTVPGVRMPPEGGAPAGTPPPPVSAPTPRVRTQESFSAPVSPVPPPIPSITAGGPPQIPLRDRGTIGTPIESPPKSSVVGESALDRQRRFDEAMRPPPGDPITRGPRDIPLADRGTIGTPMQPPTGRVDVTEGPFRASPPPATPAQGDWPLPPNGGASPLPPIAPPFSGTPGSRLNATGYQQGFYPDVDPTLPIGEIVGDQIQKYFAGISPEESRALHSVLMNMIQGESSGRAYDESGRVLEGDSDLKIGGKPAPSLGLLQLGPQARADLGADDFRMATPAGQLQTGISYLLNLIGGSQRPDWKGGPSEEEPTFGSKYGITSLRDALAAYNTGPGRFSRRNRRFEAGTPSLGEGGEIAQGEFTPASPYGPSSDYVQKALRGLSPEDEALINQYIQRFQQGL